MLTNIEQQLAIPCPVFIQISLSPQSPKRVPIMLMLQYYALGHHPTTTHIFQRV